MTRYVVVVPTLALNHSTNEVGLFSFEALGDDEAVAYVNSREGLDRFRSGGVNWYPAARLRRSSEWKYIPFKT